MFIWCVKWLDGYYGLLNIKIDYISQMTKSINGLNRTVSNIFLRAYAKSDFSFLNWCAESN